MSTFKLIMIWLGAIVLLSAVGFALNYADFAQYKFFAPRMEQVRHNTFDHSQSRTDGMQTRMDKFRMEYMKATPEQRVGIRDIVLSEFASYNGPLTPSEAAFYQQMKDGQ
jgi:hypothetical protein